MVPQPSKKRNHTIKFLEITGDNLTDRAGLVFRGGSKHSNHGRTVQKAITHLVDNSGRSTARR